MNTPIKWWMLTVPGIVFVLVLLFILSRLPQPEPNFTSVETLVETTPVPSPTTNSDLYMETLHQQIVNFRIDDPTLTSPSFDRKISLPAE